MQTELIVLNEERNVTLTAYIQQVNGKFANIPRRPAIIIMPGGGYQYCSDREADPVAFPYLKAGYQVFILRYSVGEHSNWPNPLSDYEQAIELIRSKSEEWHVYEDKIAVIGFSAGGHLAASAATMSKNRPNAAILGYPVTTEEVARLCIDNAPDTINAMDDKTCPCFLFTSRTDTLVPIENTIKFVNALVENDIAFESHIYSYGNHGFSTGDSSVLKPDSDICSRVPNWVNDSIEWLKEVLGDFNNGKMTNPKYNNKIVDDSYDFLSVDCTLGLLLSNEYAKQILVPVVNKAEEVIKSELKKPELNQRKLDIGLIELYANQMTLRTLFEFANVPDNILEQFDNQLKQIPNK